MVMYRVVDLMRNKMGQREGSKVQGEKTDCFGLLMVTAVLESTVRKSRR